MLYRQFVALVGERSGLRAGEAEKAIQAVLEVLAQLITRKQAEELASTLPLETRSFLQQRVWPDRLEQERFLLRVAQHEEVDKQSAHTHARAVLSILVDFLPSPALLEIVHYIPDDIRPLFREPAA